MHTQRLALGLLAWATLCAARAQDLPLPLPQQPVVDPLPLQPTPSSGPVFLKPTKSIKVPVPASAAGASQKPTPDHVLRDENRVLMEQKNALADRREVESRVTAALKRIVVMQGAKGQKLDQKSPPPNAADGRSVTLIGIDAPKATVRSLEGFFGVQLTPDNEKRVLETLRKGMAGTDQPSQKIEVLGWWPNEGVMAVGVSPEG